LASVLPTFGHWYLRPLWPRAQLVHILYGDPYPDLLRTNPRQSQCATKASMASGHKRKRKQSKPEKGCEWKGMGIEMGGKFN